MEDIEFYNKVDELFESKLKRTIIRVKDLDKDIILGDGDMNYNKVLFDSELNIYKMDDGKITMVDTNSFKAIVI